MLKLIGGSSVRVSHSPCKTARQDVSRSVMQATQRKARALLWHMHEQIAALQAAQRQQATVLAQQQERLRHCGVKEKARAGEAATLASRVRVAVHLCRCACVCVTASTPPATLFRFANFRTLKTLLLSVNKFHLQQEPCALAAASAVESMCINSMCRYRGLRPNCRPRSCQKIA